MYPAPPVRKIFTKNDYPRATCLSYLESIRVVLDRAAIRAVRPESLAWAVFQDGSSNTALGEYKGWAVLAGAIRHSRSGIPGAYLLSRGSRPIPFVVPWILKERNGLPLVNRPGSGGLFRRIPPCPWYLRLHNLCDPRV